MERGFGEAAEGSYVRWHSGSAASVIRMSVIQNPEHAHSASLAARIGG